MSHFIGSLAIADVNLMNQVKVGVIGGSIVAALMGVTLLTYAARLAGNRRTPAEHAGTIGVGGADAVEPTESVQLMLCSKSLRAGSLPPHPSC